MGEILIRGIRPGMKDINLTFIILDVNRPTKTKEGREVRTVKVADRSGSINLTLWDEVGKLVQSGDIIRMTKGFSNIFKNCLTLCLSKLSDFHKMGEFCLVFSEVPFLSEPNSDLVIAALASQQSGPPPPPGSHGPNGPNKPNMFRGGVANNGNNSNVGTLPPGQPPPMGGGGRFSSNGERRRIAPPIGHAGPPPSQLSTNKWPVPPGGAARPVALKDKIR